MRRFSLANLWRMKRFYLAHGAPEFLAQAVREVNPGIAKPVVSALSVSLGSQAHLLAPVIVDLDPEVYRLGYGTEEGLLRLPRRVR